MHPHFDGRSNTWQRQAGWLVAAAGVLTLGGCLGSGKGGPSVSPTATPSATPTGTLTPQPTLTPGSTGITGRIAFASTRDGNSEIYILDQFTTQRITTDSGASAPADDMPVLSPDGNRLAWASNRGGNDTEIIIAQSTGGAQPALTTNTVPDYDPAFSPNGQQIAFTRTVSGGVNQIFVINVDGTGETQVTTNGGLQPFYSSDGSKIVFSADRPDANAGGAVRTALYTINVDGTGEALLYDDPTGIERNPHWSPTGNRILFSVRPEGTTTQTVNSSIVAVNADGTNPTTLVAADSSNIDPTWSPSGTSQIAYASNRDFANGTNTYRLFRQNATAGATPTLIEPTRTTSDPGSDFAPDWR